MIEWTKTESGECKDLEDVPEGAEVCMIDGVAVIGRCESCGRYLLSGMQYACDDDGVYVCQPECPEAEEEPEEEDEAPETDD